MGYNLTKPLSVTGAKNLLALLVTAGYAGSAILSIGGFLQNMDAAADIYIHFIDSNLTAPSTNTDGIPFGPTAGLSSGFQLQKGTDLSTIWLFPSAGTIVVNAAIQG
jgi:hypothetical protein